MNSEISPGSTDATANPWRTQITLLTLAHVVGTIGYLSVMTMAPVIRGELGLNATQVGSLMSAYYLGLTIGAIPGGVLVDRLGVGTSLVAATAMLAAGAAIFASAGSYPPAVTATLVMGLGYSLVNPATAKGVLEWFKPEHRATAMGVKQMGVPIGGLVASAFGAIVVFVPWRNVMWITAALTIIVGLFWWRRQVRPKAVRGGLGAVLIDLRAVYTNRRLGIMNLASVTFNFGQQSFSTYLTLFLRDVAGASQPFAALCMGLAQVSGATGRVFWAFVSDRFTGGRRKGIMVGTAGTAALAMALAAAVDASWPEIYLALLALLLGGTVLAYAALLHTICAETVAPKLAGAAIGSNLFATSIGGTIGPIVFGATVDATGSYTPAWLVTAGVLAAGVILFAVKFREVRTD